MDHSRGPVIVEVAVAFGVLTALTITLRLGARIFLVGHVGPDDILICFAALLSWSFMTVTVIAVQHGMGSHISDVLAMGTDNLTTYSEVVWLSSMFYNATLGFIKVSVLALYMRLGDRLLWRLSIVMIGVVTCQATANVLACIFQCTPVRAAYDQTITTDQKTCININAFYLANAAVNIFTDLLTYTLPIKLIINLQISRRQKIGLGVVLCLGLFACVSSIIRITFIPTMLTSDDATYVISDAMYWSVIEINIGILAASIPSLKPIASRYMPRLLGSSYNHHHHGTSGQYPYGNSSKSHPYESRRSRVGGGGNRGHSRSDTLELSSIAPADDHFAAAATTAEVAAAGRRSSATSRSADTKSDRSFDAGCGHLDRLRHHDDFSGAGRCASVISAAEKAEHGSRSINSSEEILYIVPPQGQIAVQTQIETRYEPS